MEKLNSNRNLSPLKGLEIMLLDSLDMLFNSSVCSAGKDCRDFLEGLNIARIIPHYLVNDSRYVTAYVQMAAVTPEEIESNFKHAKSTNNRPDRRRNMS